MRYFKEKTGKRVHCKDFRKGTFFKNRCVMHKTCSNTKNEIGTWNYCDGWFYECENCGRQYVYPSGASGCRCAELLVREEREKVKTEEFMKALSKAIKKGLIDYFRKEKK